MAIATGLVFALLVVAVRTGMRVPGTEALSGLGSLSALDYSRLGSGLAPLSSAFVDGVLGPAGSTSIRPDGSIGLPEGTRAPSAPARVQVDHPFTNDDFEDAYGVRSIPFTAKTDVAGAGRQAGEPGGCAPIGDGTVWYRFRPGRNLGLIANTVGTKQATSLAVFTGEQLDSLEPVEGACHTSVSGSAYVTFPARAGSTYHFQITGVADEGPLVFNLDPLGTTEMVSGGNSGSGWHSISADGRYVAFSSASSDLVDGDGNDWEDMFVRDLKTGAIEMVSVSSEREPGNRESEPWRSAISADGRYVAFTSMASNLVDGDTNGAEDVFVHDRRTGETTRVSVSTDGKQGEAPLRGVGDPLDLALRAGQEPLDDYNKASGVSISADGRFVTFDSNLTGLVPEDGPGAEEEFGEAGRDVFVHDRATGRTSLTSASTAGLNGDGMSLHPSMSPDGRVVTFSSAATNLLGDGPASSPGLVRALTASQVYVRDLRSGITELVSVTPDGRPGSDKSIGSSLSADGRFVAFYSVAPDLIENDANEGLLDVFVRDRLRGVTEVVSLSSAGEQKAGGQAWERAYLNSTPPSISWDGRFVAFHSDAPLVPGDTDETENIADRVPVCDVHNEDVFLRDRLTHTTLRVSDSSSGVKGNGASAAPVMSADARRIAFVSVAENLAPDRPSTIPKSCWETIDVFVHTFPVLR